MEVHLPPYSSLLRNYFPSSMGKESLKKSLESILNDLLPNLSRFNLNHERIFDNLNLERFIELRNEIPSEIVFNPWIMTLYLLASDPSKEFSMKYYQFLSFEQVIERVKSLRKRNPEITWTDVALCYGGMGTYRVLRMDLENGGLFIQGDGGANGYDRQYNWERYRSQKVAEDKHITFLDFIFKN